MRTHLMTIGRLARHAGVSVRTVRYWSDEGLLPVAKRSRAGYRLFGTEAVARIELIVTLRELGLGHAAIQTVLADRTSLAGIAAAHVEAIDHQIRSLERRRSVLRVVARRGYSKETRLMHAIANLSAAERQALLDDLVDRAFDGIETSPAAAGIREQMRSLPPNLPDDPTEAQLDAWIELAELVADASFAHRVRDMALASAKPQPGPAFDPRLHDAVLEHAGRALAEDVAPNSEAARTILERIVDPAASDVDRIALADRLERFSDARVERYWQLMAVLNDRPVAPPMVPSYQWVIEALRARA